MIEKGACRGGHMDIVRLLIEEGAYHWNKGLLIACGHLDIVKLMIEKGATDLNGGLKETYFGCHIDVIKFLLEKGANNWNCGLLNACRCGNVDD